MCATLTVEGINLTYYVYGNEAGVPLIFIHGWSCDASFWDKQIDAFSDKYKLILMDLPGFGNSGKPQDIDYTHSLFAKAVHAVAEDAKAGQPVLIGHSMGYAVCRQYLLDYPGEVRAVINVDGAYFRIPETAEELAAFTAQADGMLKVHKGPNRAEAVREFVESTFYGKTAQSLQKEIMAAMSSADPYAATSALLEMFRLDQWEEHSFDIPSLAVYATSDYLPTDQGEYLKTVFPNLVYVEWDDVGHYIMLEQPERFNNLVLEYLGSLTDK